MSRHIPAAGFVFAAGLVLTAGSIEAGHCCCRSGYSIGDLVAPVPVAVHRGLTTYRTSPGTVYYGWPSAYDYPSVYDYGYRLPGRYRPYSFYRPGAFYRSDIGSGITISIGSSYRSGPYYRSPYGYSYTGYGPVLGYPSRYGIGRRSGLYFSFGSSSGRYRHR